MLWLLRVAATQGERFREEKIVPRFVKSFQRKQNDEPNITTIIW